MKTSGLFITHVDGINQKTIGGILSVILKKLSPNLTQREKSNYYYKRHAEHKGFDEIVAKAQLSRSSSKVDEGKIPEAEVKQGESEKAFMKETEEAEG